jgi:hypothetical protein
MPDSQDSTVISTRVKDCRAAREVFQRLREADDEAARGRASVQAMFDGAPPYDEQELASSGQAFRCNVNFDEAGAMLEHAMAGYVDLFSSVETLMTVKVTEGEESSRPDWEQIIAEELTRMIREWPGFSFNFLSNVQHFVGKGVGICYFDDTVDWRFSVAALGDFFIPRRTKATEDEIEVACCVRKYTPGKLCQVISNPTEAAEMGWNVSLVKEAIRKAMPTESRNHDWERIQEEMKNNDLFYDTTCEEISLVFMWAKEKDGSVSQYVFLEESISRETETEFLCKRPNAYENMLQAFVFFTYGIGTNGYYHSIRGLGYKIFPHIQLSNRARSQFYDGALLSSTLLLQPETENALEELSLVYYGPYSVLNPGMNVVERPTPNTSQAIGPMLSDLQSLVQSKTSQYSSEGAFNSGRERTRFEVQAHLEYVSRLNVTALNIFYEPWRRLIREMVRRILHPDYVRELPGGMEVEKFFNRCVILRGVPEQVIRSVDISSIRENRAVGSGSEAARMMALEEFMELMGTLDETGRQNLLRDKIAARIGYEAADRYAPKTTAQVRPPIDIKVAELENHLLLSGVPVSVQPNEIHRVHIEVHLNKLNSMIAQVDQQPELIPELVPTMVPLHEHLTLHLDQTGQDATLIEFNRNARQLLQQAGEIIYNGLKHLQKLQRQQAEEVAASGQPASTEDVEQQKMAQELERRLLEHQVKLKMMKEEHDLKLQMRMLDAQQKRLLNDAKEAARLAL